MKKVISIFAIIFITATAFVAPAATAAPTSQELKGTWIGIYGGFEGNQKANGGQEKISHHERLPRSRQRLLAEPSCW